MPHKVNNPSAGGRPHIPAELQADFRAADTLAWEVLGTTSPNPPVGALIFDEHGELIGRGATQPPGQAHAEVMALADARCSNPTRPPHRAVVTLEPCNHTGRTGPCAQALLDAGIREVDFLFADPGRVEGGGAERLRRAGICIRGPFLDIALRREWAQDCPRWAVEPWLLAQHLGRPHVTLKLAGTLDGRAAAADRTSQWITNASSRAAAHRDRARRDAILVGTGTVLADDPWLTARDTTGSPLPENQQPLRVILGSRPTPESARIFTPPGRAIQLATHDPSAALAELVEREQGRVISVLLEGGPTVAAGFIEAGLVDDLHAFIAPAVLGSGVPTLDVHGNPGAPNGLKNPEYPLRHDSSVRLGASMSEIRRFLTREVRTQDGDIEWILSAP